MHQPDACLIGWVLLRLWLVGRHRVGSSRVLTGRQAFLGLLTGRQAPGRVLVGLLTGRQAFFRPVGNGGNEATAELFLFAGFAIEGACSLILRQ